MKAHKPGYQPWEQEVQVTADKRMDVVIELTPLPGSVAITGHVAGVEVWVGTDKLGETTARQCPRARQPPAWQLPGQSPEARLSALGAGGPGHRRPAHGRGDRADAAARARHAGHYQPRGRGGGLGGDQQNWQDHGRQPPHPGQSPARQLSGESAKPGYQPWEQEIQVNANQRTEVVIDLQPLKPSVVKPKPPVVRPDRPVVKPRSDPPVVRLPPKPPVGKPRSEPPVVTLPPKPPVGKPRSEPPVVKSRTRRRKNQNEKAYYCSANPLIDAPLRRGRLMEHSLPNRDILYGAYMKGGGVQAMT